MKYNNVDDMGPSGVLAAPLYSQMSRVLRDRILQKSWVVGAALPSEADLARSFGVSVGTARKALQCLEEAGLITRKQGRGTFVANPSVKSDAAGLIRLRADGQKVLDRCTVTDPRKDLVPVAAEAEAGLVLPGSEVVRVRRRLSLGGRSWVLEKCLLRSDLCPTVEQVNLLTGDLSTALREQGLELQLGKAHLSAVTATPELSKELAVSLGAPLLQCRQSLFDAAGRIAGVLERWLSTADLEFVVQSS